jgi:hypothetical protein
MGDRDRERIPTYCLVNASLSTLMAPGPSADTPIVTGKASFFIVKRAKIAACRLRGGVG